MVTSVCMCQTNIVLTKQEYEKLLKQRDKARKEVIEVKTRLTVYRDSVISHRQIINTESHHIIVTNDCDEFKKQILQLKNYNSGLIKSSEHTNKTLKRVRLRLKPETYKTVVIYFLGAYLLYRTIDDLNNRHDK